MDLIGREPGLSGQLHNDAVSDADSDELELRLENVRFEQSVQAFLASYRDPDEDETSSRLKRAKLSAGRHSRVNRKEAEPRADIKLRLAQVNRIFLDGDYLEAERRIHEIIRINAETYQAWMTLATICEEQGRDSDALTAKLYSSHLRPKDASGWLSCAALALGMAGDDDDSPALKTAGTCFASAVLAQPTNIEARLGRAEVNHRRGHLTKAIREYSIVLDRFPHDISLVRKLAEACEASRSPEHKPHNNESRVFWGDVSIYAELLACMGDFRQAISQIGSLSRWLLSRHDEVLWASWDKDDREWDHDSARREEVPGFDVSNYDPHLYGPGLPLELRARLGLYRLKLGQAEESSRHLSWLDPTESSTATAVQDFPGLIRDIADALYSFGNALRALDYYELLRNSVYGQDPDLLLDLGRCHLIKGDTGAAEDCFLLTIQVDDSNIDARIELARIYEDAREDEEALILVTEAIALQGAGQHTYRTIGRGTDILSADETAKATSGKQSLGRKLGSASIVRPRYRPKRLVAPDQRRREEHDRADELSRRHKEVRDLKRGIQEGNRGLITTWMAAARDLVDDFRSFRKFYTWDKYVKYLGAADGMVFNAPVETQFGSGTSELHELAERLSRNVAPTQGEEGRAHVPSDDDGHRGIPFGEWLELFLDYAISLALEGRGDEAYQVCEAARDSIVFVNSKDYMFLIHVAWAGKLRS
ncbi:hypothetical protein ACHAQH_003572 [Verticillium albo-atrum]